MKHVTTRWAAALLVLAACGRPAADTSLPAPAAPLARPPIDHVIVVVQENRSFDNLFAGYPGADSAADAPISSGGRVSLRPVPLEAGYDVGHLHADFIAAYDDGRMDGFDRIGNQAPNHDSTANLAYVPRAEVQPYWDLASAYVLGDRMFQSQSSASFTSHQFLVAGTSGGIIDVPSAVPWGCDAPAGTTTKVLAPDGTIAPGPFPCLSYATIADSLDAAGIAWRYYAPPVADAAEGGIWSAFDAVRAVRYGRDWSGNVVAPETTVLDDITAGRLPPVAFVVPDAVNSDHPHAASATGPSWVSAIVNAVGASPYWSSSAIVIFWDDWGGWYDHVAPPQLAPDGLGFRTPLLIVSPYARAGYVTHAQYETASVLTFIERTFGLPSLGTADARAASFDDAFDFTQRPRPFVPIRAPQSVRTLRSRHPSLVPPDAD